MPRFFSRPMIVTMLATSLVFVDPAFAEQGAFTHEIEVIGGSSMPIPNPNEPGELHCPFGVQFDSEGVMWVVEYDGGRVLKQRPNGNFQAVAGDSDAGYVDGPGSKARFNKLHNLVIAPQGTLFLSEHLNHAIRVLDPATRVVSTLAGNGEAGFAGDGNSLDTARFNQPISIALSSDGHSLLIADIRNRRIRRLDIQRKTLETIAGNGSKGVPADGSLATKAPLVDPRAVAVDGEGNIYLAERGGHAIRVIRDGRITTVAGTGKKGKRDGPALKATFNGPKHIEIASDGRVYLADDNNDLIRIYDPATQRVSTLDTSPYQLNRPHGVTAHEGYLYVSDSFHHRILKVLMPVQ